MDTTVVATTAIGALAGLGGALGGVAISVRNQRWTERSRQRERAAEVFGSIGPLLTELTPDPMVMRLPPVEPGKPDPTVESLRTLQERVRTAGEQLSMLAAWWPTAEGSDLARRLGPAFYKTHYWDMWLVSDARRNRDFRDALEHAQSAWGQAQSLADELRAEIRGEAAHVRPRLLLPAHPSSWRGSGGALGE